MLKFNSVAFTKTGKTHASLRKDNEDTVNVYEDEIIFVAVVADGASQSPCARVASEANAEAVIELAKDPAIWTMKNKPLKLSFSESFERTLRKQPYTYELLCSTAAAVIINKHSMQYIALSVGDCMVASLDGNLDPELLLAPTNILFQKNRTFFTNDSACVAVMKMRTGRFDNISAMALVTDGAEELFEVDTADSLKTLAAFTVIDKDTAEFELEKKMDRMAQNTNDDLTAVIVSVSNDEMTTRKAAEICGAEITAADREEILKSDELTESEAGDSCDENIDDNVEESTPDILEFLKIPRSAEELVVGGYCAKHEIVVSMYLLLASNLVEYSDHMFRLKR